MVFVDLGYTSLQVTLCAFNKGKVEVKAKASDPCLGGSDFDYRLMEHFAKEFKVQQLAESQVRVVLAASIIVMGHQPRPSCIE